MKKLIKQTDISSKIEVNMNTRIMAAEKSIGTTWYAATLSKIKEVLDEDEANIWIRKAFQEWGLNAYNLDGVNLVGSGYDGDTFYFIDTDGQDIIVNGKEENPEEALMYFSPETELAEYIQQATDDIILKNTTEYEIKSPLFNRWAVDLLTAGYDFMDLVIAMEELP